MTTSDGSVSGPGPENQPTPILKGPRLTETGKRQTDPSPVMGIDDSVSVWDRRPTGPTRILKGPKPTEDQKKTDRPITNDY